jgi:hypothetical protein
MKGRYQAILGADIKAFLMMRVGYGHLPNNMIKILCRYTRIEFLHIERRLPNLTMECAASAPTNIYATKMALNSSTLSPQTIKRRGVLQKREVSFMKRKSGNHRGTTLVKRLRAETSDWLCRFLIQLKDQIWDLGSTRADSTFDSTSLSTNSKSTFGMIGDLN